MSSKSSLQGLNGRLIFAIIAGALGSSFQHGYNTGVVNAPEELITNWINETLRGRGEEPSKSELTFIWSIAVSIFCLGGMIGGSMVGTIADRFGRKGGLLVINILVVIAAALQGFSRMCGSYEMIILGRLVIGINAGLNAGLAPMYLSEISPTHLRGAVGTVYQLIITMSILFALIIGTSDDHWWCLGNTDTWPLLLAITIVPAIFQCIALPFCPESPKYLLLSKGKDGHAQKSLSWLRSTNDVYEEMEDMRAEYESVKHIPQATLKEMLTNPALRIPLIIAVMIMLAQQLSGINAIMFFSTKIFGMAGLKKSAQTATIGLGAVNVFMTLVSLVLVERYGRKTLLLFGFVGMAIVTALLAIFLLFVNSASIFGTLSVICVYIFIVVFATGPGSIPWFLVSELFNLSAKPVATSVSISINWGANFLVGLAFSPLVELIWTNVFFIFVGLQVLFALFIWMKVPETKGKSIEEISSLFRQRSYQ